MNVEAINSSEGMPRNGMEIQLRIPQKELARRYPCARDPRTLNVYLSAIHGLVDFCYRRNWITAGEVVGAFFGEPWQTIKSAALYPFGWKEDFNFYHLNPKRLTPEQAALSPTLLIHGDHDNQSAWLSLAKRIDELGVRTLGPLYTVNLSSGTVTQKDYRDINRKLSEIRAQYAQRGIAGIRVNIVGHSRGGEIISSILQANLNNGDPFDFDLNLRKVIVMGAVVRPEIVELARERLADFQNRVYEINGHYDIIEEPLESYLPANQRLELDEGHLGLTFSGTAHRQIIEWLQ